MGFTQMRNWTVTAKGRTMIETVVCPYVHKSFVEVSYSKPSAIED